MTGTKAALGTPCEVEGGQEEKAVADQQQMTLWMITTAQMVGNADTRRPMQYWTTY